MNTTALVGATGTASAEPIIIILEPCVRAKSSAARLDVRARRREASRPHTRLLQPHGRHIRVVLWR